MNARRLRFVLAAVAIGLVAVGAVLTASNGQSSRTSARPSATSDGDMPAALASHLAKLSQAIPGKGGAVEVSRWKRVLGIAEDLDRSVGMSDHHIVVDEKVRVVVILVLSGDKNGTAIGEASGALAEPLEAPTRAEVKGGFDLEVIGRSPGAPP